uniref:T-complex protein 11 n=1 Tax=Manihot esculenta TaxID=3983 RepID=A0A2C9V7N5_MANES
MATGMESSSPETGRVAVALDFPLSDMLSFASPPRLPGRLRKRLLEARTPINYNFKLTYWSDRLDIPAKAQGRLARLDELREAAKTGAELQFARERERLGTKVELQVQQAEANRMLILKANRQRRATQKERMSQSLLRRMAREGKYKERVHAAIIQKRAAAERKRLGFLEAENKRACARVLQVRQVSNSVCHQREIERGRMRDQLEAAKESHLSIFRVADDNHSTSLDNIDQLLKRVATPKKRTTPRSSMRDRETKKVSAVREAARSPAKLSRYPVRVVLCAYMILGHPDAVFSGQGDHEFPLAKSAKEFILQFELLIRIILDGPIQIFDEESDSIFTKTLSQLAAFDKAWCSYLNCFVLWKVKDAQTLEEDMVRAACQLELSMIQKCKMTPGGDTDALSHDMKAIQKQVTEDQKLLREKIQHLSGDAGIEHMEHALSET